METGPAMAPGGTATACHGEDGPGMGHPRVEGSGWARGWDSAGGWAGFWDTAGCWGHRCCCGVWGKWAPEGAMRCAVWGWPWVPCPPWGRDGTLVPGSVFPCSWPGAVTAPLPRQPLPGPRGGFPQPRGRRLPARLLPAGRGFRRDRRVLLVLCLPLPSRHPVVWGCRPCPSAPLPHGKLWVTPRDPKVGTSPRGLSPLP